MARTRLVRFLVVLAVGTLSGACATTRYTQSRIDALPPDVEGKTGSRAVVEIEGLRLSIQALDRTPAQETLRHLALQIEFEPHELGYSFDPGQVLVRTADGREWRAAGGRYRPVSPKARFFLAFDVAVEPGTGVDLVLGGLARGTKRLEPVSFHLARRRGRSIDRMYWLEGLAVVALTPLAIAAAPLGVAGGGM
jgi:hypothetical protein